MNARWSEDQSAAKPCQPARVHAGSSGSSPIFCLAPSRCRSASPMRRSPGMPISAAFSSGFWHFAGSTRQCRPSPSRAGLIRATAGSFVGLAFGAGSPRRFRHAAYGETDRPARPALFHSRRRIGSRHRAQRSMKVLPGPITCAKDKLIGEKLGPCAEPVHSDPWCGMTWLWTSTRPSGSGFLEMPCTYRICLWSIILVDRL